MLQVRRVPDDVHAELKRRAKDSGLTLSDFALRELERAVERPSIRDVLDRAASRRTQLGFTEARSAILADRAGR